MVRKSLKLKAYEMSRKVRAKIIEGASKIGYARVSSPDQNIEMQIDALDKAGCEVIYKDDGISGARADRPGLKKALAALQPGDTFVFWKVDRIARSLLHLLTIADDFERRGIQMQSLTEPIDTTSPMGRAFYQMCGVFAELLRSQGKENQREGIDAAKRRGKHLGRPFRLTADQIAYARARIEAGEETYNSMAHVFKIDRSTMYRNLKRKVP